MTTILENWKPIIENGLKENSNLFFRIKMSRGYTLQYFQTKETDLLKSIKNIMRELLLPYFISIQYHDDTFYDIVITPIHNLDLFLPKITDP